MNTRLGIFIYCLMMVLLGATIGSIAGLSITSVTGTVIEIVASVVAGSAGLYFLSRKRDGDDRHGAGLIGSVGVLFLAAFWVAYHFSSEHRYDGTDHYQWESGSLHRNVALAEIYGHAQKLGIAREDLAQELVGSTDGTTNSPPCDLLTDSARVVSDIGAAAYGTLAEESIDEELISIATYISDRFGAVHRRLKNNDADAASDAEKMRDQLVGSLVRLTEDYEPLRSPYKYACASNPKPKSCKAARRMEWMLETCTDVELIDALTTMRAHARKFGQIWREEVSTKRNKGRYAFEAPQ